MRAFIAIDIPDNAKKEIANIQKQLPEFKGKLTEESNLHLTLKFLGEISEEQTEKIKESLKKIKFRKFTAKLSDLGFFSESFIRIIWIKLENCDELQKEVDNELKDLFKKEERFMSHLTIARVKAVKDKKRFIDELKKIKVNPIEFEVSKVHLKKSVLTSKGPVYEDVYSASKKSVDF